MIIFQVEEDFFPNFRFEEIETKTKDRLCAFYSLKKIGRLSEI